MPDVATQFPPSELACLARRKALETLCEERGNYLTSRLLEHPDKPQNHEYNKYMAVFSTGQIGRRRGDYIPHLRPITVTSDCQRLTISPQRYFQVLGDVEVDHIADILVTIAECRDVFSETQTEQDILREDTYSLIIDRQRRHAHAWCRKILRKKKIDVKSGETPQYRLRGLQHAAFFAYIWLVHQICETMEANRSTRRMVETIMNNGFRNGDREINPCTMKSSARSLKRRGPSTG
jgi:hypothetical protein